MYAISIVKLFIFEKKKKKKNTYEHICDFRYWLLIVYTS